MIWHVRQHVTDPPRREKLSITRLARYRSKNTPLTIQILLVTKL